MAKVYPLPKYMDDECPDLLHGRDGTSLWKRKGKMITGILLLVILLLFCASILFMMVFHPPDAGGASPQGILDDRQMGIVECFVSWMEDEHAREANVQSIWIFFSRSGNGQEQPGASITFRNGHPEVMEMIKKAPPEEKKEGVFLG